MEAWDAITELLQEHDKAIEEYCLNKSNKIKCDYSRLPYKQSYSLSNLESTSPILNLLEDNNTNADKKRDLDKLSDLLPEKATKHRSVAHYKDNNNSTPSNSSTVTEDSENKNINKTDKSSKKSGGYIPIHKREQKQNSLLYSFQTITKN